MVFVVEKSAAVSMVRVSSGISASAAASVSMESGKTMGTSSCALTIGHRKRNMSMSEQQYVLCICIIAIP